MLVLEEVSRRYASTRALDGVSLTVPPGRLTALVGENGAGKSTLLRIAATLETPTSGRVRIAGVDPRSDGASARRHVAYLGQEPGLYDEMTVRENLAFVAAFHGRGDEVPAAAGAFAVVHKLDERAGRLSRGERQRVALARALLAGGLMLLDEPTTALDAAAASGAIETLLALRGSRTLLVATHDEALLERADRIVRLRAGRLLEDDL